MLAGGTRAVVRENVWTRSSGAAGCVQQQVQLIERQGEARPGDDIRRADGNDRAETSSFPRASGSGRGCAAMRGSSCEQSRKGRDAAPLGCVEAMPVLEVVREPRPVGNSHVEQPGRLARPSRLGVHEPSGRLSEFTRAPGATATVVCGVASSVQADLRLKNV